MNANDKNGTTSSTPENKIQSNGVSNTEKHATEVCAPKKVKPVVLQSSSWMSITSK